MTTYSFIRSFLKWPGGKYRSLPYITSRTKSCERFVEPFLGSGTVFLNTNFKEYLLADINHDLINVFNTLKTHGTDFIQACRTLFDDPHANTKEVFLEHREQFNTIEDPEKKACLFIYLNRHVFNGLMRYNSSGQFNAPFGKYLKVYFPEKEMLTFCSFCKEHETTFLCQSFQETFSMVRTGDLVYCDPPYLPLVKGVSSFTSYSKEPFGLKNHRELAKLVLEYGRKGIPIMLNNHDSELIEELYGKDIQIERFYVQRNISADPKRRKTVPEILILLSCTK